MTEIEQISRAIAVGCGRDPEAWKMFAPTVGETIAALRDMGWQRVPEGCVVVPIEPTNEMICAGLSTRLDQEVPEAWKLATLNIYRAMLKANEKPSLKGDTK